MLKMLKIRPNINHLDCERVYFVGKVHMLLLEAVSLSTRVLG